MRDPAPARDLAWDGCLNVRDLGGHVTEGGRETRFGAVVRADSRSRLTDAGWDALAEYGISRIVDLRFHEELDADPPRNLGVELVHVSLLGRMDDEDWEGLDRRAEAAGDQIEATALVYGTFLDRRRAQIGRALEAIADAPPGPVLVHCVGGKDRTGIVSALLLRLCGVSIDDVDADYAATEPNLREHHDEWIAAAPDEVERRRRSRISASPRGAMAQVLDRLEREHGSVDGYMRTCGLAEETVDRLRARLLSR